MQKHLHHKNTHSILCYGQFLVEYSFFFRSKASEGTRFTVHTYLHVIAKLKWINITT